jgi:phage terminase large subunit GpA-like protein
MKTNDFFKNIDPKEIKSYESELYKILDSASVKISDMKPSEWAEANRIMTDKLPGPFSYDNSPYTREIVDCLAPDHPAQVIAIMKGAQIGFSTGVVENGIGWIISQNPGNVLFLVGHEDVLEDASTKVDQLIDNSGLRKLIRNTSQRSRKNKSGDKDKLKQFPNGQLKIGLTNHKSLRNITLKFGFIDDYESMKGESKEAGNTRKMVEQRFAAHPKDRKIFFISSPELKKTSNIEPVYLLGDQRKWHFPCPCCGEFIVLEWEIPSELNPKEMAGITWKLDDKNKLIPESVGYICYKCGNFFDDRDKNDLMRKGKYIPTAEPIQPGYYSYHVSALYATSHFYGWEHYVRDYLEAHPIGGERDESLYKTFVNVVLGQTYEEEGKSPSATQLQNNIRPYEIGSIPEKLSISDGNGRIVLITCAADMNGTEDDARLDYEIVAYSEGGQEYSIDHGSIGTFIPRDKDPESRTKFSYKKGVENSVWPLFDEVLSRIFIRDSDGGKMKIFMTGLDTGYLNEYAYPYVNESNHDIINLKGDDKEKYTSQFADQKSYKKSLEKNKLYLVRSNYTKDVLARKINLKWDPDESGSQPFGFMNFPTPSDGKYLLTNYFSHFEAEHKIVDPKTKNFVWKKRSDRHQNHLFDCRLYNGVVRDIYLDLVFSDAGVKNGLWQDYVEIVNRSR